MGLWLATGVGTFLLLGSAALIGFFHRLSEVEETVALESLGRTNALFLDQSKLPQTAHMEAQLGQVMDAQVRFSDPGGAFPMPVDGKARRKDGWIRVGYSLRTGREVWFSRDASAPGRRPVWKRADALGALGGFWVLSIGFTLWLASQVSRPLARLEGALVGIGGDSGLGELPDSGPREIVSLSRALRQAHVSLIEERGKRRHAERLAWLGQMAASLAHEIRNPISAIRLHAQLLEKTCIDGEEDPAAMIVSEAGRIESLVSQWLQYAKPAAMKMGDVHLADLARSVQRLLTPQADHAGVRIQVEEDPGVVIGPVRGDWERLHQVLYNLVINAIQSMPMGGVVTLGLKPRGLVIADQGGGFSPTALANFGTPFHTEREGGMGLGLAVSKDIIDAHGAVIRVENQPGHGACIHIDWPQSP